MSLTRLQPLSVNANADFTFANVTSTYFLGNGYFLTGITTGGTSIVNGNSNVAVNANSNVTIGVAGTSNVVVVTQDTVNVTGNVSANFYTGNGYYLTGITGGTSYSNTNVAAYLPTYTGNVSANYFIGNGSTLTDITGANVVGNVTSTIQSHYANIANSVAGANVSGNVSYAITSNYANTANTVAGANVSGNVADAVHAYYADVANSVTGANVSGQVSNALIAGTVYTDAQPNITSVGTLSSLTVSGLITATSTGIKAANIQDTSGTITLVTRYGNQVGDVGVYGNITAGTNGSGNVVATYFVGNGSQLTGITGSYSNTNVAAYLPTYTGNVAGNYFIGNGATLTFITGGNVNGNVTSAVQSHYANIANSVAGANVSGQVGNALIAGTVYTNAQPNITSVGTLTSLTVTGNVSAGNITGATYVSGTLTTAAQPNITSVGTLTSLSITGNVSAGNATITGNITAANANITDITAANATITGNFTAGGGGGGSLTGANLVSAVYLTGTLTTAAQPNVTSLGNLTSLTITANGNITSSGSLSQISGANLVSATYLTGTLTTAAQPNITSVGTLSSLTVTSNVSAGNVKTDNLLYANGTAWPFGNYSNTNVAAYLPTYTGNFTAGNANISGNLIAGNGSGGSITGADLVSANYLTGTLTTAAQPNITSVGTLSSLTVTSNVSAGNVKTDNLLYANGTAWSFGGAGSYSNTNVAAYLPTYTGNVSANYFIGNGATLTFITGANVSGNVTSAVQSHYANIANSVTGANVSGNVTSAVQSHYANIANSVTGANVSGNVTSAVQSHYANIANSVTGANVSGQVSNALIAGTVYTNAQPNITSVGTLSSLDVTSNVSAGNVKTDNLLYANGTAWSFGGGTSYSNTNVAAYLPTYTGNVSANYFIGNGATLTNIAGANVSGNVSWAVTSNWANIANSVTGANVSGNVTSAVQSHYANIANSVAGANVSGQVSNALIAGTVYTDAQPNITSVGTLSSLTVSGLITATGTGIKTANIQDTSGTVTLVTRYGSQSGDVGVYGNITAGTNGSGNVTATYFIGNGSQLTGLPTSYSNTNVAAYLPTYTGNISAGNLILTGSISDSAQLDILTTASSANIVLTPNGSGNVNTPANLTVTGNVTASGITANNTLTIQQVAEKVLVNGSAGSGNFALDYSTGSTLLLGGLSGNINLVISNLPSSSNISIVTTVVITQGGTAYIPANVYVGTSLATILWSGGTVPTGTASKTEAFSFALLNNSGTWTVLGQNSSYG